MVGGGREPSLLTPLRATPVIVRWLLDGYLLAPDSSQCRHILYLDSIARFGLERGCKFFWSTDIPHGADALTLLWSRDILLRPSLIWRAPHYTRRVWLHETAHALVGPSCEKADEWIELRFGELIEPERVA